MTGGTAARAGMFGLLLLLLSGATVRAETVYVVSNSWHTSLVLVRGDLPDGLLPEAADLPDAAYLEIGWGERVYYRTPHPSLWQAIKAIGPSPAVLHMAGFSTPPVTRYAADRRVAVTLSRDDYRRLVRAVDASFERGQSSRAHALGPGLYGESFFYPARGRFDLFHNCNDWTAHILQAGGVPLSASGIITAGLLMARVRRAVETEVSRSAWIVIGELDPRLSGLSF
ncbi:DUF2459 domain-containing protein [Govanella unica]|uniref:DUF2459 domain-containing protein n=1 Tax=Govanella unica TaxID=2975056 RepID=A0A9X3TYP7_9PROT|nr:DUF2459 domain-containing protein [Govania unica]MDA5193959.1 DUF2459 domain-containing protein [Govania unica]